MTAKYNSQKWREALEGRLDIIDVLEEGLGDRHTARIALLYIGGLAEAGNRHARLLGGVFFVFGFLTAIGLAVIVRIFS